MKRTIRTGPKRRRWRRRDWSGRGGYGQERRWGSTVGNFKREREAKRAPRPDEPDALLHRTWDPIGRASATYAGSGWGPYRESN